MARWGAIFGGFGGRDDREERRGNALLLIVMSILAPLAASSFRWRSPRSREYGADDSGARLAAIRRRWRRRRKARHGRRVRIRCGEPADAHLFIRNPLAAFRGQFLANLSAPPAIDSVSRACAACGSALAS